ncbi:MAG: hypothetical protein D6687_04350 [Acidobacteria bacterium]|jgi:hypothetical protein|nr:MAG: hypothetical protein D6687_04350 [Acidobacteriota bacterium]GIU82043.1 MAG: hypothetical protein KatS3mg006_1107 [Pyrinomonadaceae bacterium]
MHWKIRKIVSGGQTGADRAALDFALEAGVETGGFVPKGRLAEDGRIDEKYPNLIETETEDYSERTLLNVINSDATIILSHGELTGGSLFTKQCAEVHGKPFLHIDFDKLSIEEAAQKAANWLNSLKCETLNVAGSRASKDPEIYEKTKNFLKMLIFGSPTQQKY